MQAELGLVVLQDQAGEGVVRATSGGSEDVLGVRLSVEGALREVIDQAVTVHVAEGVSMPGLPHMNLVLMVPFTGPDEARGAILVARTQG
jgi:hypothetical protein